MNKESAARILEATFALDASLNELMRRAEELPDNPEKKQILKAVGDVMGLLTMNIIFPLADQHPELGPEMPA